MCSFLLCYFGQSNLKILLSLIYPEESSGAWYFCCCCYLFREIYKKEKLNYHFVWVWFGMVRRLDIQKPGDDVIPGNHGVFYCGNAKIIRSLDTEIALYIWYCTDITQSQIDFEILIFKSLRKVIHSVRMILLLLK